MTDRQKRMLIAVVRVTLAGRWYRAGDSGLGSSGGERVTLASLHTHGLLDRRAWRGVEGARDAAHEYRATERVLATLREMREAAPGSSQVAPAPAAEGVEPSGDPDASKRQP